MASRKKDKPGDVGIEIGSDGVDAVVGLGNGLNFDTDGEVGLSVGNGMTIEMDGDIRIGGINLTGD